MRAQGQLIRPRGEPIEILSTWRYTVPLNLKETELVANSIYSTKTFSGNEGTDVKGLRNKNSAQTEITSSRGTLINNEA